MNGNVAIGHAIAKWFLVVIGVTLLVPNFGCRLCCDTEDIAYPAYGGAWQRTRRDDGRVGSLFDPAGARTATLTSREEPQSVDELYRNRSTDPQKDAGADDADDNQLDPNSEDSEKNSGKDPDAELKRRSEELKNLELEDIDLVPGEPLPPELN
jgi:hypothetical protein